MKDTRGLIFNKVTGEYRYEEIREKPLSLQEQINVRLTNWDGKRASSTGYLRNTKYFD